MRRPPAIAAALVVLAAAATTLSGCGAGPDQASPAAAAVETRLAGLPAIPPPRQREPVGVPDGLEYSRRTAIVQAAERVAPAVVSVNVRRREAVQPGSLWESLFLPPGEREVSGLGSGFIIREDGLVLTNEHVIRGADQVVVTLGDGREFEADLVGTDEVNDLALLRIRAAGGGRAAQASGPAPAASGENTSFPVAPLGNSDDLMIGEWLVAIGNPFGYLLSNYEPTVTAGVVSGIGRNMIPAGEKGYYLDMIQTDASINPGNSGGPLVNALGEVIGVNSSILSRSGGSEGLGFAIPINRARRIALDLLDNGQVRRAWVGLELEAGAAGARSAGGGTRTRVARVAEGSPAAEAGVRPGMLVREVGGKAMRGPLDWEAVLLNAMVGESLELVVDDEGRARTLRVTPADLPSVTADRIRALTDFELVTLTPSIRAERRLANERGALIIALSDVARQLGLREGDLLLQINRTAVGSAEEAARLLKELAGQGPVQVVFERQGRVGAVHFYINR
jgi:serine protease Do